MKFENSAEKFAEAGSRALGALISKFKDVKNVSYNCFTKLYNACVATVLDNASEIWGFTKSSACEKIQYRAIRYFLGVHRFCPIPAMTGDMGWPECRQRRMINMIRFWNRLVKLNDDRLTKRVFLWDYEINHNNWSSEIQNILEICNELHAFYSMSEVSLETIGSKLSTYYAQLWSEKCCSLPKLRTYILFKSEFKCEQYVTLFMSRKERSLIAQLRTGILPIRIENGRFHNVKDSVTGKMRKLKAEERLCQLCNSDNVEKE